MGLKAVLNWKQQAAARRDFRHTRGGPEVHKGPKHRRKACGCKKAWDDKHVLGEPQLFEYAVEPDGKSLGYKLRTCTLCMKKDYEWID